MSIDFETKNYLEETIDRKFDQKFSEFSAEIKRHNDTLAENLRSDLRAMTEQLPTRTEVREIVREEMAIEIEPMKTDIAIIKNEVREINRKMDDHENRIVRLEEIVL